MMGICRESHLSQCFYSSLGSPLGDSSVSKDGSLEALPPGRMHMRARQTASLDCHL